MHIDVMVCTDCWWNLPSVIAQRILASDIPDKIMCSSHDEASKPIRHDLTHLPSQTDLQQFMKEYVGVAKQQARPIHVLVAGQGWRCGTHYEKIGVRTLSAFVPAWIRLFVDTDMMALPTQHLDRTCRAKHVLEDPEFQWRPVSGTMYEMCAIKQIHPDDQSVHLTTRKRPR